MIEDRTNKLIESVYDRRLQKYRNRTISGGLILGISVLALKCDMNKNYFDVRQEISAIEIEQEKLDTRVSRIELTLYEQRKNR